jgi:hypothetical protein
LTSDVTARDPAKIPVTLCSCLRRCILTLPIIFPGDPDESYAVYESTFLLNMLASKIDPEDAASVVQKTLTENALKIYVHRCGGTKFESAEDVLYHPSANFEDESSSDRVDEQFHILSFAKFHRQKHVNELTEVEAVKLFYPKLLGWQSQLEPVYHADEHRRDRLILTFSSYSKSVKDLFTKKRPRTSQTVLQKICKKASYEMGIDLLPHNDTDVLRREVVVLNLQSKMRERAGSSSKNRRRKKGPKAGC